MVKSERSFRAETRICGQYRHQALHLFNYEPTTSNGDQLSAGARNLSPLTPEPMVKPKSYANSI
jgi:hypothetical protein